MKISQFTFRGMSLSFTDKKNFVNAYFITLSKTEKIFKNALPTFCNNPIEHNIKQISNPAPTLTQYWELLQVYPCDVNDDGEPTTEYFDMVNENFFLSTNLRHMRKMKQLPLYFYHIDEHTHKPVHLPIPIARVHYAKMYEKHVNTGPCRRLISILRDSIGNKPVVVRGFSCGNKNFRTTSEFIENVVNNPAEKFGFEYCLIEILINFPNLNGCWWNNVTFENGRVVYNGNTIQHYIAGNGIYTLDDNECVDEYGRVQGLTISSSPSRSSDDSHDNVELHKKRSLEYNLLDF